MARGLTCREELIGESAMRVDVCADGHQARDRAGHSTPGELCQHVLRNWLSGDAQTGGT